MRFPVARRLATTLAAVTVTFATMWPALGIPGYAQALPPDDGAVAAATEPTATTSDPAPNEVAVAAVSPTPAPAPSNPAYGVFYSRPLPADVLGSMQQAFGAGTWLSTDLVASPVPGKLPVVSITPGARPEGEALANLVRQYPPGTAWYLGGEANVPTQGNLPGADYATYFHDAAQVIREVDPTAVVLSASVLNFSETCRGCSGYTSGHDWVEAFRTAYLTLYGEEPPVDAWALDCYLLDWRRLPMIDSTFLPAQVTAMRTYLDSIPGQAGKPIWLTEFGVVWAYDDMQWIEQNGEYVLAPAGEFREDLLEAWLQDTLTWLETEGRAESVARWYLFASSAPPDEPWYQGIQLVQADETGTLSLTPLGQTYAAYAQGLVGTTPAPADSDALAASPPKDAPPIDTPPEENLPDMPAADAMAAEGLAPDASSPDAAPAKELAPDAPSEEALLEAVPAEVPELPAE